jgi:exodeoxyribonuclease VII small subunit
MAKKSFEDALERLEQITEELERGDAGLEASLKKFDEGVKLAEFCNRKLDEAQKKVDLLLKKNDTVSAGSFADTPEKADS